MYQKCLQKPIWVSCAEIFWSISNLKVSERSVKDVLDWLVKNDLVIYQADKYQIAKREFMDISRRKALEKKETEENAEVRSVEYGTSIPPHTMNHHPWLEREYQQPVVKPSNTMFAIIALIAFLISGTLVGILLFNSFATERRNNAELTYLPDSIQVPSLQVSPPDISATHIRPTVTSRTSKLRWKHSNGLMLNLWISARHNNPRLIY